VAVLGREMPPGEGEGEAREESAALQKVVELGADSRAWIVGEKKASVSTRLPLLAESQTSLRHLRMNHHLRLLPEPLHFLTDSPLRATTGSGCS